MTDAEAVDQEADDGIRARHAAYWRRNLRYLGILLTIWFVVSYGLGILLAEPLNDLRIPGTGFRSASGSRSRGPSTSSWSSSSSTPGS